VAGPGEERAVASAAPARRRGDEPADAPVAGATAEASEDAPRLTARELEVLALLARGVSTRGISERRFISLNTARNHVQRTIAKLGAHSRLEAVTIARRHGLLLTDQTPG
jgi:DNA-binding NarL/FixJ family response regulator